jgi:hypothetical protein
MDNPHPLKEPEARRHCLRQDSFALSKMALDEFSNPLNSFSAFRKVVCGKLSFVLHAFPDFQGDVNTYLPGAFSEALRIGEQELIRADLDQDRRQIGQAGEKR